MAEQYSVQLDLQVGQLFQRLDQLERRLAGVSGAAAQTQSVMDRFRNSAGGLQTLDAAGARMQRTMNLMAGAAKNTNEGMQRLEKQFQAIVDKTDRSSRSYQVATQNLERLRASMRGAETDAGNFASRAGGLQAVMAVVGAGALVNGFKKAGVEAAMAERKLGFLTTEYGEQAKAQEAVLRVQKQLGVSNTEAKQGIANLYAALRPTGIELKNIEGAFLGYAKAARRTGQSNAEISSGMLQLKQALGSGVLQGDELRSIRENAPAVAQAIAKVMGTTVGGLKKLGETGQLTSAIVLQALNGLANSTIPPITAIDRLTAAWTDFQAEIAGSLGPMTSGIIGFAASLLEGFERLPGPIKDLVTALGALTLAAVGVAGVIAAIGVAAPAVVAGLSAMGVTVAAGTGLFGALGAAAAAAWTAITGPVGLAVIGMALLTKAAYDLNEPFRWWVDNLGPALGVIWNDLSYLAKDFGGLLSGIGKDIQTTWESATDWFAPIGQGFRDAISKVKGVWDQIPEPLKVLLVPGYGAYKLGQAIARPIGNYLSDVQKRVEAAKKEAAAQDKVKESVQQAAKAKELTEKQLKKLADVRTDAEQKIAELRLTTTEKAKAWEQEIAKDRLATERRIADLQSKLALNRDLSAIDASMAGDGGIGDKVKADQKVMLQAKWDMEQKILGANRTEDDRQKTFTEKLEAFKLETNKASGRIQQEYAKKSGELVQGFATTAAQNLEKGGLNAGAAIEASATRAAQTLGGAMDGASGASGGGGGGGSTSIAQIADSRLTPIAKAWLATIRFAEGTSGSKGYQTMFTGKTFSDMSRHPRQIQRGGGYASDAAGAYQFLSTTWDGIGGGAMTPERQDRGAVALAQRRGVNVSTAAFTKENADRLAPEWASFPTKATGTSYYGQGGKSFATLKRYYERALAQFQAEAGARMGQAADPFGALGSVASGTGPLKLDAPLGYGTGPSPIFDATKLRMPTQQGPNTRPSIPLGQKAILSGNAVVWNGRNWEADTATRLATGGQGAQQAAAAGASNNIVPTGRQGYQTFNPASVGAVNPNQFLGGVQQAQNGLNSLAGKEKELQTEQAITEYLRQQQEIRTAITGDLNAQLGSAQQSLQADQQRLELLRSGINPAYAEQFVQIDQMAQVERARLTAEKERIEKLLEQKDLHPLMRKGLEDDLKNTVDRLAAEGGITQAIKDQIAARQALKDSPGTKITEKVAQMKAELADTGGMIVSLAGTIEGELGSAMSNAIQGVISGTTTVQQAFSQMFKNIGAAFIDMATKMIAKALIMKVLGLLGGGAGGGGGFGGFGSVSPSLSSGFSGTGSAVGGWSFFADGGYVTGPTQAVVGEGGEPEHIIPESKMAGAMKRYNAGVRGPGVLPGNGESGGSGDSSESGGGMIEVGYRVTEINSVKYVTEAEFQAGMQQAAQRGAAAGHQRVFGDLRNSRSQRSRVGIR